MNALIVVDIQNDFLPSGALPVPEGDAIIPVINGLMQQFELVVATQDWHPANHESFAAMHTGKSPGDSITLHGLQQTLWHTHCVQGSAGASFASSLNVALFKHIIRKGIDPSVDSYSGFFDNGKKHETGLQKYLRSKDIDTVFVAGLATDYCVKYTALDAVQLGFHTYLIQDAAKGVNLQDGDVDNAIDEMRTAGITITQSKELIQEKRK